MKAGSVLVLSMRLFLVFDVGSGLLSLSLFVVVVPPSLFRLLLSLGVRRGRHQAGVDA